MISANKELKSLGERLKKLREALGLSVKEAADEIQAPQKYVTALEEDDYKVFPAKVYALGFIKKLLGVLAAENPENFIREFNTEWDIQMFHKNKETAPGVKVKREKLYLTPRRLGIGIIGIFLLVFLIFSSSRVTNFVGAPGLEIKTPADRAEFSDSSVEVKGATEKESRLTVNGRELKIDQGGNFDEKIELPIGLNALEFVSKNRFGRETKIVRYVLIK